MSKRAEKRALELFPVDMQMCIDSTGEPYEADVNEHRRKYVAFGYEQAEKDLALTAEDIATLIRLCEQVKTEWWFRDMKGIGSQKHFEEVLRRFNEMKEKNEN